MATGTGFNFKDASGNVVDMVTKYELRAAGTGLTGTTNYYSNIYGKDLGSIFYLYSNLGALGLTGYTGVNSGYKLSNGTDIGSMFCIKGSVVSSTSVSSSVSSVDPTLVYYYKFNAGDINGSNMLANYASGTAVYDATVYNGATIDTTTTQFGGGSLSLNGTNQYISLPAFTTDLSGLSFSVWCKTKVTGTASYGRIFDFGNGAPSNNLIIMAAQSIYCFHDTLSNSSAVIGKDTGNWVHFAWTLECTDTINKNGTWKIYFDNVLTYTYTNYYYPYAISRTLNYIGKSNWNSDYLNAYFDEFRMYKRVLTQNEVSNLYTYNSVMTLGLLSTIPTGCVGLFACKWVNSNYTGPILKLRKSSDTSGSNYTDFYMDKTGTVITTAAYGTGTTFATWLGADTAYVNTWYDQSGLGKHATQTTTTLQPTMVKDTSNFYMVDCTVTGKFLNLPDGTIPYNDSTYTMTVHHGIFNSSQNTAFISSGTNTSWLVNGIYYNSGGGYVNLRSTQINPSPIISYSPNSVYTVKYDQSNFYLYLNSTLKGTVAKPTLSNSTNAYNYIGGRQYASTDALSTSFYQISLFNNVLSDANRTIMENIGQGYSAQTKAIDNLFSDVKPWGIYDASLWNGSILPEARGNGRNVTSTGAITYSSGSGNGATASIPSISGGTTAKLTWPAVSLPANFTICAITRYTNSGGNQQRILTSTITGTAENFLLGHYNNNTLTTSIGYLGVAIFNQDFRTSSTGAGLTPQPTKTDWLVSCAKSAATVTANAVIMNGKPVALTTGGGGNGTLCINAYADATNQLSDWAFTYLVIYDSALSDDRMITVSDQLRYYLITGSLIVTNGFFSQSIAANNVAVSTTNLVNYWTVSSINTFYLAKTADLTTYTRGGSTTYPYVALPSIATQFLVSNLTSSGTHSITQSVNIDVAGVYTLTFYYTGRLGTNLYATTHTLSVDIGPKNIVTALQTTNTGWQLFTGSIVLTSTDIVNNSLKFTFNNSAATNSSFYITGVALNYVAPYVSTVVGTGLLSTIPTGCVGLFACKWVNNNYKGPILTLRRSSDSVLQDFYMDSTGTIVTTGAYGTGTSFATWIGANTAYVYTWYDQSGLGNHATQTTVGNQPIFTIYNSIYTVSFDNAGAYFNIPPAIFPAGNNPFTFIFKMAKKTSSASILNLLFAGTAGTSTAYSMVATSTQLITSLYANDLTMNYTPSDNATITFAYSPNTKYVYYTSAGNTVSANLTGTASNYTPSSARIGHNGSSAGLGSIQYITLFTNYLNTTDRTNMESI